MRRFVFAAIIFACLIPATAYAQTDTAPRLDLRGITFAPAPERESLVTRPPAPRGGFGVGFLWGLMFEGEDVSSSHSDGGGGEGAMNIRGARKIGALTQSLVARVLFQKEWDASYAFRLLGGWRLTNDTRFKYPYFYELMAGVAIFPDDTTFEMELNWGMFFPKPGRSWAPFFRVGLPILFFSGNTEIGTGFALGFLFGALSK